MADIECLQFRPKRKRSSRRSRGDEEIESSGLSKRKRDDDSVQCWDIIPFSEENNYPWMNKKKEKTHFDIFDEYSISREPMDSTMVMNKIMKTYQSKDFKRAMKLYLNDIKKSDGFDVKHEPPKAAPGHKIFRIYDPPNIVPEFEFDIVNTLICLSKLAISVYNQKKGTNYDNVQVMMAMKYGCRDVCYNITFKASIPSKNAVTFQTKASLILKKPYQIAEIKFIRKFNGEDREENLSKSEVIGEDSEKLPFYLSEFALGEYNLYQLSCSGFTMKQDEMYGDVNDLSWKKRISKYKGPTYSITFRASSSMPDKSKIVKNFRTKILVSFCGSTTKIDIKYVKSN